MLFSYYMQGHLCMFSTETLHFLVWAAAAIAGAMAALALQWRYGGRNRNDLAQFADLVADLRRERDLLTNALLEARAEIERLRQEVQAARQQLAALGFADGSHGVTGGFTLRNRTVLAILGDDPALLADEAALRAVESAGGLVFRRIRRATKAKVIAHIDRARLHGRPYDLVHVAAHMGAQGVLLSDGLADGAWLSERLQGAQVTLLAGCEGDAVGDWLGGVRYPITIAEAVSHEDASRFTQAFWTAIGIGLHPEAALAEALERAPAGLGEYVERHW